MREAKKRTHENMEGTEKHESLKKKKRETSKVTHENNKGTENTRNGKKK